jgi:hypothetical protein
VRPVWQKHLDAADFDLITSHYENVVAACLAADTEDALDEAVARFVTPVNTAFVRSADPQQAVETILWAAWTAVVRAAEAGAERTQARLVDLVTRIKVQDLPQRPDRRRDLRVWDLRVYADLPVFGAQMREEWDVSWFDASRRGAWVNLNAFAARLTAAGMDFSLYALWTLRDCLEGEETAGPDLLAAAAHWFTLCGPLLASRAAEGYAPPQWGAAARVGRLCADHGITRGGFGTERWEFWRARLAALANESDAAARAALTALSHAAG